MNDKASFEFSPPPISVKDIRERVNTDVVVLGAGVAGLAAAVSAAEGGAKTILLEKGKTFHHRGLHNAAIASKLQKEAGIKIDKEELIYSIMTWGGYKADQRVIRTWADNCDKVMNWLIDMAKKAGIEVVLDPTTKPWYFDNYPTIHFFMPKWQHSLCQMMLDAGQALGAEYRWNNPAVQLLRDGQNRVHGVMAQNPEGDYTQFNVSKAVVLCTGDYGGDREMVKKYCAPAISTLRRAYDATTGEDFVINTGDGHKMAMWIGAAMEDAPHTPLIFDFGVWTHENELFNLHRQPWLYVDIKWGTVHE